MRNRLRDHIACAHLPPSVDTITPVSRMVVFALLAWHHKPARHGLASARLSWVQRCRLEPSQSRVAYFRTKRHRVGTTQCLSGCHAD